MKNLFLGVLIGAVLTALGVWAFSTWHSDRTSPFQAQPKDNIASAQKTNTDTPDKTHPARVAPENESISEKTPIKSAAQQKGVLSVDEWMNRDAASAVQSLAAFFDERRYGYGQMLIEKIKALKEKGKEGINELLLILDGDSPELFKIVAAGVIGEIFTEYQDPEIRDILQHQVLPLLQGIIGSGSNMMLKRQAIRALGELTIPESQQILVDLLTNEPNQRIQLTAMRVLQEKGTLESAYELVEVLQSPEDMTQLMFAASTIGKINDRLNDPALHAATINTIPILGKVIQDDSQTFQTKRGALFTLGALGTKDAIDILIDVVEEKSDKSDRLQRIAVWSLVRNGSQSVAESLGESLSRSESPDTRILLASAIAGVAKRSSDPVASDLAETLAIPTLQSLSTSEAHMDTQKKAIAAIGLVGSSKDLPFLQQISDNNAVLKPTVDEAVRRIQDRETGKGRWRRDGRWRSRF